MAEFPGPPVPARPASTVIVLRPSADGFELLMVRRGSRAEFMGDAHVFPGGAVGDIDDSEMARCAVRWDGDPAEAPWRAAALRELVEEVGLALGDVGGAVGGVGADVYRWVVDAGAALDADRLAYVSNWVTPVGLPKRFDTRFYAAEVPEGTRADADGIEVFDSVWVTPEDALNRGGEWNLPFPTRHHLELLARFDSPGAVMSYAEALEEVPRVQPRLSVRHNGVVRVVMPGDPGYEAAVR